MNNDIPIRIKLIGWSEHKAEEKPSSSKWLRENTVINFPIILNGVITPTKVVVFLPSEYKRKRPKFDGPFVNLYADWFDYQIITA